MHKKIFRSVTNIGILLATIFLVVTPLVTPLHTAAQVTNGGCPEGSVPDDTIGCISTSGTNALVEKAKSAIVEPFGKALGWVLISTLGGISTFFTWIMQRSSDLFEVSVSTFSTLQGFDGLYSSISTAVETTWTFIRDLANITIIGLFVFIAISIILGLKEYGEKKLIARILMVAVLINFSFLFTRIIINTSNFFSSTIYTQMVSPSITSVKAAEADATGTQTPEDTKSLGRQFRKLLEIGTINYSPSFFSKEATTNESGTFTGALIQAFANILFAFLATLLFIYGALLILSRFLALMMCLLLSSLAFATFLLPSWSAMGWSKWWSTLIKNALLAPVMMIFLWASLSMAQGIHDNLMKTGRLSELDSKVVIGYILILGLFGAGMYIASQLATNIGHRVAILGTGVSAGLVGKGLGSVGRQTIGRGGTLLGERFAKLAKEANARGQGFRASMFDLAARGSKMTAKRDYNIGNTGLAQSIAKAAGLDKKHLTSSVGGFEGYEKKRNERNLATAERLTYSEKELKAMKGSALEEARNAAAHEVKTNSDAHKDASAISAQSDAAKRLAEDQKKLVEKQIQTLEAEKKSIADKREAASPSDLERHAAIERELASKAGPLKDATDNATRAATAAATAAAEVTRHTQEGKRIADKIASTANTGYQRKLARAGLTEEDVAHGHHGLLEKTIERTAYGTIADIPLRWAGIINKDNSRVIAKAGGSAKDHHEAAEYNKMIKAMAEQVKKSSGGGGHPTPAATEAHPPEPPHA